MKRLHQLHDLCRGGETERKRNFGALAQSILMMHGVEPVLHFDPRDVVRLLRRLPTQLQAAFALACADRLAPAYVAFVRASGRGPDRLAPIRERLWRRIAGEADDSSGAIADIEACMSLIPAADDAGWVAEQPAADDAAAALTHALRAWDTHDPQEAVRAAQRCYSAVERHVLASQGGTEIDRGRSNELVRSPLFQAELKRQDRDLHYLARLGPPHNAQRLSRLRDRAKRESQFMFALDPERMPKDGRK